MRRSIIPAAVLALLLAGCTPAAPSSTTSTDQPSSQSTPQVDLREWTPHTTSPDDPGHDDNPAEPPDRAASAADEAAAVARAELFMRAFTQTDKDQAAWFAGISDLLTPYSRTAYAHSQPSSIPASAVTGDGVVVPGATETIAAVDVPTDAGVYRVELIRASTAVQWSVDRAVPPEGQR